MEFLKFAQELIRFPSISPDQAGSIDYLEEILKQQGFKCIKKTFGPKDREVTNLYAEFGSGLNLCFAGHVDVVPVIDETLWKHPPFAAIIEEGKLYGRGTVDMKGAIACFLAASLKFIKEKEFNGKISFLITSDEETEAKFGTKIMLEWLKENNYKLDFVIVGEPTNPNKIGEMIKIGRRGSANYHLTIIGKEGHAAYPQLALNPVNILVHVLSELKNYVFDQGTELFDPTNLEIVNLEVGNKASNIIPKEAKATFNIRFNNLYNSILLKETIENIIIKHSDKYVLKEEISGESFVFEPSDFSKIFAKVVKEVTDIEPVFSTTGGTSDARFIKDYAICLEFGLINNYAHKINEFIEIRDLQILYNVYYQFLYKFFKSY